MVQTVHDLLYALMHIDRYLENGILKSINGVSASIILETTLKYWFVVQWGQSLLFTSGKAPL